MDMTLSGLLSAARATLADPRGMARQVIQVALPLQVAWMALLLTTLLSTLLAHLSILLLPAADRAGLDQMVANPIATAMIQVIAAFAGVQAVYLVGRWRGGRGTLPQAVALMAWLQFVLLILQVAQVVAEVVLPPLAMVLAYVAVGLFLWLLVNFVMELHGFQSVIATLFGIFGTMIVLGFLMLVLLAPLMPMPGAM